MMQNDQASDILLCASRELLLLVDPKTLAIIAVNTFACELLGFRHDEVIGRPITDLETALQDVFYWAEVSDGNFSELINAEGLYACANGDFLPVEKSIRWWADAEVPCIVICARDARAQVSATSKLLEASAVLQATFESTAEGILVLTRDGNVLNYNQRCVDIWGHSADGVGLPSQIRLLKRVAKQTINPQDSIERWRILAPQDNDEYADAFEFKDGRTIRCRSRPLMMQEQIEGRVISFSDITERIQREKDLAAARDAAAASSKAKADFLAMMSHEIRTPLTGILGMTELILDTELSEIQREHLEMSNQSAKGLLTIINDILDFSRIEAGKLQIENIPFDLIATVKISTRPLVWQAEQRNLKLELQHPDLAALWVLGDPTRVQQIVINLVGNAIKFTETGSVTVAISCLPASPDTLSICISVRDTGIGISQKKLGQIFDAFTQADASTNRRFGGTGLGLAISNRLARLMGGRIDVESEEGRGSCFHIRLALTAAQTPESTPAPVAVAPAAQKGLSILIAEDTRVNQVFLSSIIKKAGHRSVICNNGEEAVDTMHRREEHFDLILMDIQMPIMDGFAATKALRERGVMTPIIALTAHATEGFRDQCLNRGMNDYLTKPIDTRALLEKIASYTSNSPITPAAVTVTIDEGLPIFDTAGALDRVDGDDEIFLMLIEAVLEQINDDLQNICGAITAKNNLAAARGAHRLKGSMGAVGAMRAHEACSAMEQAGKTGKNDDLVTLFGKLNEEINRVRPLLSNYVSPLIQKNSKE